MIDGVEYLNSGDWVESLTALVEDTEGNWKIIYYKDWLAQLPPKIKKSKADLAINEILPHGVTINNNG